MRESLADLQSSGDGRGVPIDRVGIGDLRHPIVVLDRGQAKQQTTARVRMAVDVASDARGAHLSRFLEILDEAGGEVTVNTVPAIMDQLRTRLGSRSAELQVTASEIVWIEDLVEVSEAAASCPVYPTLKREDERFITMKAYDKPAFVEDVVRDVAVVLRDDTRVLDFSVEAVSDESIHNHTAFARVGNLRS